MQVIEFLEHPSISKIFEMNREVKKKKELAGYNLFTISSYTYYLENFHSDIIYSLLDPSGLHNEGYTFLYLFIDYINENFGQKIELSKYENVTIHRETGRLDVWIKDELSKHSIIIENKINDAPDRDDQLLDYYEYAQKAGYKGVDVVVYLSKDGSKIAPAQNRRIDAPIINVGAFMNTAHDLLNGWLKPSLSAASNDDSKSFLYQYCKLISHLSNNNMDNEIKEAFYQFVDKNKALQIIEDLKNLTIHLPDYRAEKFEKLTTQINPFKNRFKYKNNYWIFEKYENEEDSYKLDVFFEYNGDAKVVMWNTVKGKDGGYETVEKILKEIGFLERFNGVSLYHGMTAEFTISEEYPSISAIDNSVVKLVLQIFERLKNLSNE